MTQDVAAVVIGRNEGERLRRCLGALSGATAPVIYVDSGSTDGSVDLARAMGVEVVELDMSRPFTAARARNEGIARLKELSPQSEFIQLVDGDCELVDGWIDAARQALISRPELAAVCGRRRERFVEASRWNRLTDAEWDTPIGDAIACGGDAMIRRAALEAVGGYRADLIAGEEPEMCFRMRQKGWKISRIDAEMTLHDAAMTRMSQWWKRNRRAGHAYAEAAALHGASPERFRVGETRRALLWGAVLPTLAALAMIFLPPWGAVLVLIWPFQVLRLLGRGMGVERAVFLTLGKIPEAQGAIGFALGRMLGRRQRLIEYK